MQIKVDIRKAKRNCYLVTFSVTHEDTEYPCYIFPSSQLTWPLEFWELKDYYHATCLEASTMESAQQKASAVVTRIMNILAEFSISIGRRYTVTF